MNTFTLRLVTAIVLFVFSVGLCGFDYWLSWRDNNATVSKLFLWINSHAPVTSMVVSFWAGILIGHLFLPQIPLEDSDGSR